MELTDKGIHVKKNLVIAGAIMMGAGVFLPIIYFLLMFVGFVFVSIITLGLDWVCCLTVSPLLFIAGLVLLIVGLVQKD
ncbi:MAG: hypothetical protein R6V01_11520 [Thermoplasmatota archaeon]